MEQNIVIAMLDEEISRLEQVRSILQSLLTTEARVAPLLEAAQSEPETESGEIAAPEADAKTEDAEAAASPIRHVSRRGIKRGQRGPRMLKQEATPRPLDAAVPKTPVVVPRSALVAVRPPESPVVREQAAADASLEAWVRALKGNSTATL